MGWGMHGRSIAWFALALGVAGCGSPPQRAAVQPAAVRSPEPRPPRGIDPDYKLPAKDAAGRFITPNSGIGPLETMFNFRAALNVAALLCARPPNTAARDGYNSFLKRHRVALANANRAVDAKYQREHGAEGLRMRDSKLTRLYNHYAYPPVKAKFCATAARRLGTANALASKDLETYSQGALAEVEQLFQDHFVKIEAWQKRRVAHADRGG